MSSTKTMTGRIFVQMSVGCYDMLHPSKKETNCRIEHPEIPNKRHVFTLGCPEEFAEEHEGEWWGDLVEAIMVEWIGHVWISAKKADVQDFLKWYQDDDDGLRRDFDVAYAKYRLPIVTTQLERLQWEKESFEAFVRGDEE